MSANASFAGTPEAAVEVGRDPRTLVIPSHTLGYAGSSYQFQLKTAFGNELAGVANVTCELSCAEPAVEQYARGNGLHAFGGNHLGRVHRKPKPWALHDEKHA